MPTGEYSVNKLSAMSGHHWNSIKEFLYIFDIIQKGFFHVSISENNNKFSLKIQNNLLEQIQLSDKDKFLIKLYLFEAFTTDSAVQLDLPKSTKPDLVLAVFKKKNF